LEETFIFQPCDLGVIAGMKKALAREHDRGIEHSSEEAARNGGQLIMSKSKPVIRNKVRLLFPDTACSHFYFAFCVAGNGVPQGCAGRQQDMWYGNVPVGL
jgi:hypothetical protein